MKKIKGISILFILVLGLFILFGFNDQTFAANKTGTVTVNTSLNVRTGAGTSNPMLTYNGDAVKLKNGEIVTIISEETADGQKWYKVEFTYSSQKLTGFVSATYVAISSNEESPTPTNSTPTEKPVQVVYYRNVNTLKPISVKAKMLNKVLAYKKANTKVLKISGKKYYLANKKSVTITAETTKKNIKWFKVKFTYKKKKYSAYVKNTDVKMTLKTTAYAKITGVKKAANIYKKVGLKGSGYKTVNKKRVKLSKGTAVEITKNTLYKKKTMWYKISYTYLGKTRTGYINSKYVALKKQSVVKKVKVMAMSSAQFEEYMKNQGFPDSYKEGLRQLHKLYPYWQFSAYKTGIDWQTAIKKESKLGENLIENSKSKAWKSTEPGAYDSSTGKWKVFDGSTWVAASKEAIEYAMDPRNFLNERGIFQFEALEYQSQYQTVDGVNGIIKNTPFYGQSFSYKDLTTNADKKIKYVNAFVDAAKKSGVSPYHLASRVKQEVVTSSTSVSKAAAGTISTYPGIFNFYNIGATGGSGSAAERGVKWASEGTTYLRPWTDRYRSIVGGAMYIGEKYIKKGQNTIYLQKFNVTPYSTYSHQYMQNVEAAYSEAFKTKQAYAASVNDVPILFSIPIYNNMPAKACVIPG